MDGPRGACTPTEGESGKCVLQDSLSKGFVSHWAEINPKSLVGPAPAHCVGWSECVVYSRFSGHVVAVVFLGFSEIDMIWPFEVVGFSKAASAPDDGSVWL